MAGVEGVGAGGHRLQQVGHSQHGGHQARGKSRGAVRGHRFGVGNDTLLGYRDARFLIYLPAYKWVLERRLASKVEQLRRLAADKPLVLLDYEINADVEDVSSPLSHAALVAYHLLGSWPTESHPA